MKCLGLALAVCLLLSGCMLIKKEPTHVLEYRASDTTIEVIGKTLGNIPFWALDLGFSAAFAFGILWLQAEGGGPPATTY